MVRRNSGPDASQAAQNSWPAKRRQAVSAPQAKHPGFPCSPKPTAECCWKVLQPPQPPGSTVHSREQYLPPQEREETAQRCSNPKACARALAPTATPWAKLHNTDSATRTAQLGLPLVPNARKIGRSGTLRRPAIELAKRLAAT